jgi:hypothetical protein
MTIDHCMAVTSPDYTLKGMKAKDIHAELESLYVPEALALPTAKKWRGSFQQGRTDLVNDPKVGKPVTDGLDAAIGLMLA